MDGAETEVKSRDVLSGFVSENKEGMLKELQDLRDMLEELYEKNVQLDEENLSLRREVRDMKGQIGNILDTMRVLREDLRKAHEVIRQPKMKSSSELVA